MNINEAIGVLQGLALALPPNQTMIATEVTVACLDAEYDVDCIQIERRERGQVICIRIEPDGEIGSEYPAIVQCGCGALGEVTNEHGELLCQTCADGLQQIEDRIKR